jgi:hypothetical protein
VVRLLLEKNPSFDADGPGLLQNALIKGYTEIVKLLLEKAIYLVAQEKFEWLLDLEDANFDVADIASLLFETVNISAWMAFEQLDINMPKGGVKVDFHQISCAHNKSLVEQKEDPLFDLPTFHLKRDAMQRSVTAVCGLAGVFPPLNGQRNELEHVSFAGVKASVMFNYENNESKPEDATTATNSQSLSQRKLSAQLHRAMQSLESAASILQETGFCWTDLQS